MNSKIYFILLIVITLIVAYFYVTDNKEHDLELEKIKQLEKINQTKEKELEELRARTKPCSIPNLNTPKDCYFESKYKCSWNEATDRCEQK